MNSQVANIRNQLSHFQDSLQQSTNKLKGVSTVQSGKVLSEARKTITGYSEFLTLDVHSKLVEILDLDSIGEIKICIKELLKMVRSFTPYT